MVRFPVNSFTAGSFMKWYLFIAVDLPNVLHWSFNSQFNSKSSNDQTVSVDMKSYDMIKMIVTIEIWISVLNQVKSTWAIHFNLLKVVRLG